MKTLQYIIHLNKRISKNSTQSKNFFLNKFVNNALKNLFEIMNIEIYHVETDEDCEFWIAHPSCNISFIQKYIRWGACGNPSHEKSLLLFSYFFLRRQKPSQGVAGAGDSGMNGSNSELYLPWESAQH